MKQGLFYHSDLTVSFGGEHSKPHNIFTATAIKVPKFNYTVKERESLGNGWYGNVESNNYVQDNLYVIIKEGVCIGEMIPYKNSDGGKIKSSLLPCEKQAIAFLKTLNIEYREI